jgi:hypothetical protein
MGRISNEAQIMKKHHDISGVAVDQGVISLVVDGKPISRDLRALSPLLKRASNEELRCFEVSPSGYGIHWPTIDEDVSVDGLLGIVHSPSATKKSA